MFYATHWPPEGSVSSGGAELENTCDDPTGTLEAWKLETVILLGGPSSSRAKAGKCATDLTSPEWTNTSISVTQQAARSRPQLDLLISVSHPPRTCALKMCFWIYTLNAGCSDSESCLTDSFYIRSIRQCPLYILAAYQGVKKKRREKKKFHWFSQKSYRCEFLLQVIWRLILLQQWEHLAATSNQWHEQLYVYIWRAVGTFESNAVAFKISFFLVLFLQMFLIYVLFFELLHELAFYPLRDRCLSGLLLLL